MRAATTLSSAHGCVCYVCWTGHMAGNMARCSTAHSQHATRATHFNGVLFTGVLFQAGPPLGVCRPGACMRAGCGGGAVRPPAPCVPQPMRAWAALHSPCPSAMLRGSMLGGLRPGCRQPSRSLRSWAAGPLGRECWAGPNLAGRHWCWRGAGGPASRGAAQRLFLYGCGSKPLPTPSGGRRTMWQQQHALEGVCVKNLILAVSSLSSLAAWHTACGVVGVHHPALVASPARNPLRAWRCCKATAVAHHDVHRAL